LKKRFAQLVQNFGVVAGKPSGLEFLAEFRVEIHTQGFPQIIAGTPRLDGNFVTIIVGLGFVSE
jgi:hypothetical protein